MKYSKRYIYDVLYGPMYFPEYAWQVFLTPEAQRLRELRLCNINSLCLTGGANINRYEHTLGTCYLALRNLESPKYSLSDREKQRFVVASILHDVYNAAFGHSLEYSKGVKSESLFYEAVAGHKNELYKAASFQPIYFGRLEELHSVMKSLRFKDKDIETIGDYINGKGDLGCLLSGSMDLDNIDNVCRLAYHVGLLDDKDLPLRLAKSIWIENHTLHTDEDKIGLVERWIEIRETLYKFLLLNPDEFSAKYMLTEAFELSLKEPIELFEKGKDNENKPTWYDVDFQLLEKISKKSADTSYLVSNLMCGQLYCCVAIYTTSSIDKYPDFLDPQKRTDMERGIMLRLRPEAMESITLSETQQKVIRGIKGISYNAGEKTLKISHDIKENVFNLLIGNELSGIKDRLIKMREEAALKYEKFKLRSPMIGIHPILDKNKTNREVVVRLPGGEQERVIGHSSKELHLAILLKNKEFRDMDIYEPASGLKKENIDNIKQEVYSFLGDLLEDNNLREHQLYSEIEWIHKKR